MAKVWGENITDDKRGTRKSKNDKKKNKKKKSKKTPKGLMDY